MPESTTPQLTESEVREREARVIANVIRNSMEVCLRNAEDQSKPEGYRLMMEHFAEAGRQILEMIGTRRYVNADAAKCEGCGQPTVTVQITDDDIELCYSCFAATPLANDKRCPHCHWKPSPDLHPKAGVYKCGNCNYPFASRRAESPKLTEGEVAEIADAFPHADYDPDTSEMPVCETCDGAIDDHKVGCVVPLIHALIRDLRALRAERDAAMKVLAPSMPESGLEDACRQLKQACMSEADNCEALEQINMRLSTGLVNIYHVITGEACPHGVALGMATSAVSSLKSENAALREQLDSAQENFTRRTEQLAEAEKEVRGVLIALGVNAIHSRPDGGAEDVYESLAISVTKLKSELARTKQHRDDLIKELQQERRP